MIAPNAIFSAMHADSFLITEFGLSSDVIADLENDIESLAITAEHSDKRQKDHDRYSSRNSCGCSGNCASDYSSIGTKCTCSGNCGSNNYNRGTTCQCSGACGYSAQKGNI